jgi:hypothetical protein
MNGSMTFDSVGADMLPRPSLRKATKRTGLLKSTQYSLSFLLVVLPHHARCRRTLQYLLVEDGLRQVFREDFIRSRSTSGAGTLNTINLAISCPEPMPLPFLDLSPPIRIEVGLLNPFCIPLWAKDAHPLIAFLVNDSYMPVQDTSF